MSDPRLDEVDQLICVTNDPMKYVNQHLTIPLGKRDDSGKPLYKVLKLKPEFKLKRN